MIFCYGNCNKAFDSNHNSCGKALDNDGGGGGGVVKSHSNSIHPSPVHQLAEKEPIIPTGEVMMKNLWLEMYNNSLTDVQRGVVSVRS